LGVKRTRFKNWPCGIARTTDLLGDWWTPLIVRDAMFGSKRFDQFQERLGLSRNILTERLNRLVAESVMTKEPYQERPKRYHYLLTDKGRDLFGILALEFAWGNRWASPTGAPALFVDRETGEQVDPIVVDANTGKPLTRSSVWVVEGPGFPKNFPSIYAKKPDTKRPGSNPKKETSGE
jgi:DNA-binding HxlR family transcriptional regulator